MIKRDGNSVSVNLTWPFVIWSIVWVLLAYGTGVGALYWVAALPWLFLLGFIFLAVTVGGIAMLAAYRRGVPITVTTPRKGTRVVQRGRR